MNKRGQGLSTNTIILIILGIIILVILALGFTMGWSKFMPWLSKNNVDTIRQSCSTACTTNAGYDFCTAPRELKSDTEKIKDATCYYLAEKTNYGIEKCTSITCNAVLSDKKTEEDAKTECGIEGVKEGDVIYYLEGEVTDKVKTLKSYTCKAEDVPAETTPTE